ncbi:MAG: GNAT family N-acetyltransferase [Candidatus Zixiibacteriota bacterium]
MSPDAVSITYQRETRPYSEEVAAVYRSAGLRRPVDDLSRIEQMIEHGNLIITARHDGRLVGVSRSLTDFCYCCYLSDLAVHADYQRHGIGKELVRLTREAIGPKSMLLLLAAPSADGYYPHLGFEAVPNGWIIHRTEQ